ncbi:MAG: DNA polymerase III subunit gamma/tau [Eubacteriales bacterium]
MYQALYRKWRPKAFSDVVGQQSITATLENEVKSGSVSHAYLFTGSRGTGKTTCAKILAKAVNCLNPMQGNPCNACENCIGIENGSILDVLEIDAASNNGVDNIREMIEETNFTPVKAKNRVYIIDEVHMLSTAACNAFLKTLEEPPSHVIFILATTDPQKLPATIRSRCQRFDFKRIYPDDIVDRLQYIAQQEGLSLENDAAVLIARIADGALRDALSLLDVCSVKSKEITAAVVVEVAGLADKVYLFALADCIKTKNSGKALEIIQELHSSSCEMDLLCSEMLNHLRSLMIVKTVKSVKTAAELLICTKADFELLQQQADQFSLEDILNSMLLLEGTSGNINKGVNKRVELEIAVIRLCNRQFNENNSALLERISALEAAVQKGIPATPQKQPVREDPIVYKPEPESAKKIEIVNVDVPFVETPTVQFSITKQPEPDPPAEKKQEESLIPQETSPDAVCDPDSQEVPFPFWPAVLQDLSKRDRGLWGFLCGSRAFVDDQNLIICPTNKTSLENFLNASGRSDSLKTAIFEASKQNYQITIVEKKTSADNQTANLNGLINKLSGL